MGMTIDEAINHLGNYSSTNGSGLTTDKQHNEAKRVAIDTMRKFQELEQEPTTKNDLALIRTMGLDEEIRCTMCTNYMKSDRGCDGSCVVNTDMYKAVMDAIEKRIQPTTKNDLGVDYVSRQAVLDLIADYDLSMGQVVRGIHALPSVTPQEPQTFKWCETCKEYDQENHCCHRWSKVIRDTVEEMKQDQESILDKIKAEIEFEVDHRTNMLCAEDVFAILDKYKAESEG